MLRENEAVVDYFAGGGGTSTGIKNAMREINLMDVFSDGTGADLSPLRNPLREGVAIAVNHNPQALAMHAINHPETLHLCEDIFNADVAAALAGRKVGAAWYSPDCTYFSAARGGKPIREEGKRVRALSLVVLKHARNPATRPRVFFLENVREYQHWGPLDKAGLPCKKRRGLYFGLWWKQLQRQGYKLEKREMVGRDYGAPTSRRRLFIIGRCDGLPIVWPEPTHGDPNSEAVKSGKLLPWRMAAECIDFTIPCKSIFGRKRPLAFNTERRIAKGFVRYVIQNPKPYIVTCNHSGPEFRGHGIDEQFKTLTAARDAHGLVMPYLARIGQTGGGGKYCNSVEEQVTTVTSKAEHCLAVAYVAKHYGGVVGHGLDRPLGTVTNVDHHSLVSSHLVKLKGTCQDGLPVTDSMPTIQASGLHLGLVNAYLIKYFGTNQDPRLDEPLHTITGKHRFGLCETASVRVDQLTDEQRFNAWKVARFFEHYMPEHFNVPEGEPRPSMVIIGDYVVVDIGLRMLEPRELFLAQGFPRDYIIEFDYKGKPLPKSAQVKMCGNSVPPVFSEALYMANMGPEFNNQLEIAI